MKQKAKRLKDGEKYTYYNVYKETYNKSSAYTKKMYVDENGLLHRDNGPAIEGVTNVWYNHGLVHRIDGPAITSLERIEYWVMGKQLSKEQFEKKFLIKRRIEKIKTMIIGHEKRI